MHLVGLIDEKGVTEKGPKDIDLLHIESRPPLRSAKAPPGGSEFFTGAVEKV